MMIVMKPTASEEEIAAVIARVESVGATAHVSKGAEVTVIGAIGDREHVARLELDGAPGVSQVVPILKPYKLSSTQLRPGGERSVFEIGGRKIGGEHFALIAGPCTVESRDQLLDTARAVRDAGATMLRGGAYKPRTSPYAFQGLGRAGLRLLAEAKEETGMPIVTELMDVRDLEPIAEVADVVQIGARNMQNYTLLSEIGRAGIPVLLKRGLSATLEELLMAAEYVLKEGNEQVMLCERGIRTFETAYRFTLDLMAVPVLKQLSHLPVVVDPSHAAGRRDLVGPLSLAAAAAGADGIIVEVHPNPDEAICDGPQQLRTRGLRRLREPRRASGSARGQSVRPRVKVGVVGVGLIGGSIGLALAQRLDAELTGFDPQAQTLAEAQRRGAIARTAASPGEAARDAQIVFVAAPISALPAAIDEVLAAAPTDCVVTDVGSTKRALVAATDDPRFIGGHPLAGAETSGVEHARADLFDGATWYLTPGPTTSGELYERLHKTLSGIGATPTAIDAADHDLVMASVSHLPHVFANVLVAQAAHALGDERVPATGPSFRDATRVAGASPTIWPDIYLSNREALVALIDETQCAPRRGPRRACGRRPPGDRALERRRAGRSRGAARCGARGRQRLRAARRRHRPAGRGRGDRARPRPRRHQHRRHRACARPRRAPRHGLALGAGRGARATCGRDDRGARHPRGAGLTCAHDGRRSLRPGPARASGRPRGARGQVGLPPRGDPRRRLRGHARDHELPARRRHGRDARRRSRPRSRRRARWLRGHDPRRRPARRARA